MSYDQFTQINESDSTHTPLDGAAESRPRQANFGKHPQFRKVATLSAALAEKELGLPAGAWSRRRLFALRVSTGELVNSGFSKGDVLVIEPGAAAVPGRLIVVRTDDALELRRVARDFRVDVETTDPDGLPFPERIRRTRIVGTVIGSIANASAAKTAGRSLPAASERSKSTGGFPVAPQLRAANADVLSGDLDRWTVWSSGVRNPALRRAAEKLGNRLRVLASCLQVASESQLYGALVGEVNKVLRAMRRTGSTSASPELPRLRELLPPARREERSHPVEDRKQRRAHAA